jgi:hypothetical protein
VLLVPLEVVAVHRKLLEPVLTRPRFSVAMVVWVVVVGLWELLLLVRGWRGLCEWMSQVPDLYSIVFVKFYFYHSSNAEDMRFLCS